MQFHSFRLNCAEIYNTPALDSIHLPLCICDNDNKLPIIGRIRVLLLGNVCFHYWRARAGVSVI